MFFTYLLLALLPFTVIGHGVNSHGGQYLWPAEQFVRAGFSVHALDLRGRGKSEGERFHVETVADYVADVAGTVKIAKAREPGYRSSCWGTAPSSSSPGADPARHRGPGDRLRGQPVLLQHGGLGR